MALGAVYMQTRVVFWIEEKMKKDTINRSRISVFLIAQPFRSYA